MVDMLETFAPVFSAENAQKNRCRCSRARIGETVAAPCVTIADDPLRTDAASPARPFDAEGVPSRRNVVVENGIFKTFLHNLKTAAKDGVESTGNASKGSYAAPVRVASTNFFIEPGKEELAALLESIGSGLLITVVEGLHAGADEVSGDFSLLARGFVVEDGLRGRAVEQITIAGNFFEMLKNVRAVASDLLFTAGGIGSPSVDVGLLSVAGKSANNGQSALRGFARHAPKPLCDLKFLWAKDRERFYSIARSKGGGAAGLRRAPWVKAEGKNAAKSQH